MRETRSPLKDRALRLPGPSLQERRDDLLYDGLLTPLMIAVMLIVLALLEWARYLKPSEPQPGLFTAFALAGLGYALWRWWGARSELRALRLGMEGEKAVGQFLDRLRESGYQVFHDVIGNGFNVDHVLIGPAGVFTVETKTRSKPAKGDARVTFDGDLILVAGSQPDRDPIVQAKAQASWLRALLAESTGRNFAVRPVIVFPGWFVEQGPGATRDIWVLEPKALPSFLAHEPTVLAAEDIRLASFHLSRFIRAEERRGVWR